MKKVSVIMSVYNETFDEISASLNSIINQTYADIEIIIVVDNPSKSDEYKFIFDGYLQNYHNIIVLYNKKNIGLAMSMNKAFQKSTGVYIARMDADDIAFQKRIEKEVMVVEEGIYDFVCTGYIFINEEGNHIPGDYIHYSPDEIKRILFTTNCIHHPTVLMKRDIFEKVGGYRDFPCSQDYDLWLRLLEENCKFYMIDEPLLKYRKRSLSTTNRKRFLQACTLFYISKLCYTRLQYKYDNYSKTNYKEFINMCNIRYRYHKNNIEYLQGIQNKIGKKKLNDVFLRILLLLKSNFIRDSYYLKYRIKKEVKKL
ncbi:glycosyltransferase [[Clostridium] innocuum]|nr:glycosyltransferase [[Clostridium] innocuum]